MSHIDDLVAEICPGGVPHRMLKEVAAYSDTRIDSVKLDATNFVGVDNLLPEKAGRTDATYFPNTERLSEFQAGDVLLGNIRPYLKKVWLADRTGGCSGDVLAIRILEQRRSSLIPEFLYLLLSSNSFFSYNMRHAKGAKMPRGSKQAILDFRVPVPPLEVQREIVRILDQFTQLEAELEAELEARRRQYEYYRHDVLRFSADVPRKTIGQLAEKIFSGRNNSRVEDGAYPVYGSTGKIGATDQPVYGRDALLVARVGANAGRINQVSGKYDVSDNTLIVWPTSDWNLRFAFHQLTDMNLNQYAVGGGQPLVTGRLLKTLEVAVPSMDEQKKVASDLDTFEALVNDLSGGLPAELAARRKQYEYYRDRLLTFKEAPA